jgi:DNA-binding transcriptional ArsR family regulator
MATSKWDVFTPAENDIARLAKALGHPARVRIFLEVAQRQTCSSGELQDLIPLSQSTVSQHIQDLRKAGLLRIVPQGPLSVLSIEWTEFARLAAIALPYLDDIRQLKYELC